MRIFINTDVLRDELRNNAATIVAVILAATSILVAAWIISENLDTTRSDAKLQMEASTAQTRLRQAQATNDQLAARLRELDARLSAVTAKIATFNVSSSDRAQLESEFKRLDAKLTEVQNREIRLEQIIVTDPAKALELPLLRRDVDSMRDALRAEISTTRQEVDRVYDLTKWLFGLLIPVMLSIVSLGVGVLRARQEKPSV